jgi:hypothetical protein
MEMKKGKANLPPQMRGQYKKQQEMASQRKAMIDASSPGGDGLPVFNLFVRTKRQNVSLRFVVCFVLFWIGLDWIGLCELMACLTFVSDLCVCVFFLLFLA